MSVDTPSAEAVAGHETDDHDDHHHPSDWEYIKIALLLGFLTLIEVGTYFESVHKLGDIWLYIILTVLMIAKFLIVIAYFMHLKFDSKMYQRMFISGLVLALGVYFIMLFASAFFS